MLEHQRKPLIWGEVTEVVYQVQVNFCHLIERTFINTIQIMSTLGAIQKGHP